jgi:hypothetical protein
METKTLNEEIKVSENGKDVILLIDYSKREFDVFKNYDDKVFTSKDIMKYFDLIAYARQLADEKLNPTRPAESTPRVKVKPTAERKPKPDKTAGLNQKTCKVCEQPFIPNSNRQQTCPECKSKKPLDS